MTRSKKNCSFYLSLSVMVLAALAVMTAGSAALYAAGQDAAGTFAKDFIPTWQRTGAQSLKFAEAMPEEHYNFKPTPDIMSFGEQVVHTAGAAFWFASKVKGEENPGKGFKAEGKSKADIIGYLKKSFDYGEKVLAGLSDAEAAKKIPLFGELTLTKAQTFATVRDHITHHRGQMVIYLRLKGVKPPQYVGW